MYDKSGQLLFSVNRNGIYNPNGTTAYNFITAAYTATVTIGATTHICTPTYAASEIIIFPVTKSENNHSYYVMFWAVDAEDFGGSYSDHAYELRAIKVDVTPGTGVLSFTDNVLYDQTTGASSPGIIRSRYAFVFSFGIAADEAGCDEPRNVYTIDPGLNATGWAGTYHVSNLRKWTFGSDGSLPSPTVSTFIAEEPPATSTKSKIITMGSDKYFAYIGGTDAAVTSARWAYYIAAVKISSSVGALTNFTMGAGDNIYGFEYVPALNVMYASFGHNTSSGYDPTGSGLAYFDFSTMTGYHVSSSGDYAATDLELNKNGDLILVKGLPSSVTDDGQLAYLAVSSSGFTPSTTLPTVVTSACSSYVSVASFVSCFTTSRQTYYLGSQIKGENYGISSLPDIVITGTQIWTPTSNPFLASGASSISSVNLRKLTVNSGASLTIQNMTLKFPSDGDVHILASTTGANGGRLYLNNTKLTSLTGGCDGPIWAMWEGVRVHGNVTQPQGDVTVTKQGYLKMENNSEISYAHIGVQLGVGMPWGFYGPTSESGGIIQAYNSTFRNNSNGVVFLPYSNFSPVTLAPVNNICYFYMDKFTSDDPNTIVHGMLKHISGANVKGFSVKGCEFENFNSSNIVSFGICSDNMGFTVDAVLLPPTYTSYPSKFSDLTYGIDQYSSSVSNTITVRNSEFRRNTTGIDIRGAKNPVVAGNKFYVPYLTGTLYSVYPPSYTTYPITSIGLSMFGTTGYSVYSNLFEIYTASGFAPSGAGTPVKTTTGILAWNSGGANNLINNNTFRGLGVANLANFDNRYGVTGLSYRCNKNVGNGFDIATRGNKATTPVANDDHGIRVFQGNPTSGSYPYGFAAGNVFSFGGGSYNLYNITTECAPFIYYYSASAALAQRPGASGAGGLIADWPMISNVNSVPYINGCSIPGTDVNSQTQVITLVSAGGYSPEALTTGMNDDEKLLAINSNINYYMNSDSGVLHRDSLYYWVNELNTPYSEMATAYMLLEDTLIDSAFAIYDSIVSKNSLQGDESLAFGDWGKQIFMIHVMENIKKGVSTVTFSGLASSIDTMTDSAIYELQVLEVIDAFQRSKGWARVKAENLLRGYSMSLFDSLIEEMPDTLLYPVMPDSVALAPAPKGVLAVTEMSLGAQNGCQYAELIVANCGSEKSAYVDIRGWVINDNSGIFNVTDPEENPLGDCDENVGITPGILKIPNDPIWEKVPIGSFLVLYNHGNNCYNLPDTFHIDTFNSVYYLPIGPEAGYNNIVQYAGTENSSVCSYCSDSGTTIYSLATDWDNSIYLDSLWDGVQVLCPGCSPDYATPPAYYHGIGYRSAPNANGVLKESAVLKYSTGAGYKYVFMGSDATQLVTSSYWSVVTADAAGSKPSTVGNVGSTFYNATINHLLDMPCCGTEQQEEEPEEKGGGKGQEATANMHSIRVYPNPAEKALYFEFPSASNMNIKLMDITGRTIDEQTTHNAGKATFDVSKYTPGVYIYQTISNGRKQTGKVVISK